MTLAGSSPLGLIRTRAAPRRIRANLRAAAGVTTVNPRKGILLMLKFLGSTVGIIFLIGLIVVIAFFKLLF
ncbi:hypothetical protein [Pseudomonas kuykendallii]|uniref:hypothetical protein n=1 Tax=Pseudomonas kuykendallii TaxID=1007099 RepID=UPI0023546E95|nr:hypothetical protein [Pseudomonas kuykendallii]